LKVEPEKRGFLTSPTNKAGRECPAL
jgi:hypothetical protein